MPFTPPPASEQLPLGIGERLCDLPLRRSDGHAVSFYHNRLFGWPKVIHLAETPAAAEGELAAFAARRQDFAQAETQVFGVTRASAAENAALAERLAQPYMLLSDETGDFFRAAGVQQGEPPRTLVFDPVLRLERILRGANQAQSALAHVQGRFAALRPAPVLAQAPALVLPNVLDPDHCRRLMETWERGRKLEDTVSSDTEAVRIDRASKVRSDVYLLLGSPESDTLIEALRRRLLPEVEKAFNAHLTHAEHFRVGCYTAEDGGYFAPHRDNTKEITAHRRYALTLNLNTGDYEGGLLRLPEYGPQLYTPPPGGAVVFSCSLLHTVTPVTKGRRFAVIGFMWGEAEQPIFERSHADMFPDGTDFNRIA